jgi:hypothetical protein
MVETGCVWTRVIRENSVGYKITKRLERYNPMDTVRAKDTEFAFIVAAEVH